MIATVIKQRHEPGLHVDCKILEVRDTDVSWLLYPLCSRASYFLKKTLDCFLGIIFVACNFIERHLHVGMYGTSSGRNIFT